MPTLNWIGKDRIINHHNNVKYRVLDKKYEFGLKNTGNMIIHGDNLEALKSLMPRFENRIKCIYIDPPYNTGKKEGQWVYSDNVDDPRLLKWLNETVGAEDDLTRHDKWLCMMYPRLKLLQKLLHDEGAIFISIDDNELFNLKAICDEIFGASNYGGLLSVEINPKGRKNSDFLSVTNDYCLIYLKDKTKSHFLENIPKDKKDLTVDENGNLVHNSGKRVLVGENSFNEIVDNFNSDKHYSVYYEKTNKNLVIKVEKSLDDIDKNLINKGFTRYISFNENNFVENTYTKARFIELFKEEALDFKNSKIYEKNFSKTIRMKSILSNKEYEIYDDNNKIVKYKIDVKTTSAGTDLKNMFNTKKIVFNNPKNKLFIELLVSLIDDKNCYVLDSFAGSGTTAHAVLDLNSKDNGHRKFIEIEMMDYANSITAERCKIAINGYVEHSSKNKSKVKGLPGGFAYYELGQPIFDLKGYLNDNLDVDVIKSFIYYTETHEPLAQNKNACYLGTSNSTAYYIFYDKNKATSLNWDTIKLVDIKADAYVIYADSCTLSNDFMKKNHIVFKKIPRDIKKI